MSQWFCESPARNARIAVIDADDSYASKSSSFYLQVYDTHEFLPSLRNSCIGSIKEDNIKGMLDDPNAPGSCPFENS
jgi:hypothetical protein